MQDIGSSALSVTPVPPPRNVNFILDENTREFLIQFKNDIKNDIINAIRTEFRQELAAVNGRVDVVEDKLDNQTDLVDSLLQRVTALENSNGNSQSLSMASAIDNAVHEVEERKYRSTNIVICGLPDNKPRSGNQSGSADALAKDLNQAKDILQKLSKDIASIRATYRLGNYLPGKDRPLKVVLNSSDLAKSILKEWRNAGLPSNIFIRSDQTPIQQQVLKDLNTELNAHNVANPNDKKTIKYVKGKAQLVSNSKKRKQFFRQRSNEDDTATPKRSKS